MSTDGYEYSSICAPVDTKWRAGYAVSELTILACFPKSAYTLDGMTEVSDEQPFGSLLEVDLKNTWTEPDIYIGSDNCLYSDPCSMFNLEFG